MIGIHLAAGLLLLLVALEVPAAGQPLGRQQQQHLLPERDSSLKRAAARQLGLCDCPFDCLKEEGIKFHNVKLTVHDLSRLVDRLPWRLERALQHKCYSLLTGEDVHLFPDLLAAQDSGTKKGGGDIQQWQGGQSSNAAGSPNAVAPADSNEGSSSVHEMFDAFLLPLISILSLMLLVLVILCQRQCILDLAAPLDPNAGNSSRTPSGSFGGGGGRSPGASSAPGRFSLLGVWGRSVGLGVSTGRAGAQSSRSGTTASNSATALVVETVSNDNFSLRPDYDPRTFRGSHSSPQIVITLPPSNDEESKKKQQSASVEKRSLVYGDMYGETDEDDDPNKWATASSSAASTSSRSRPPFDLDLGWLSSRVNSTSEEDELDQGGGGSGSKKKRQQQQQQQQPQQQERCCRRHRGLRQQLRRPPQRVAVAVTPPPPPPYSGGTEQLQLSAAAAAEGRRQMREVAVRTLQERYVLT